MDWIIDIGLAATFRMLKEAIKNPQKKATWRRAMLKLRDTIDLVYGDEPEFGVDGQRLAQLQDRRGGSETV